MILLLGVGSGSVSGQIVDRIAFAGLERTRTEVLIPFLSSQPGEAYDRVRVEADVQALRNLQRFADVEARLITQDGDSVLVFNVAEYRTRLPILDFGGISENFWFQAGLLDLNWQGRLGHSGAFYRFYDRHSFALYQDLPYLFSPRWGASYTLGRGATREPAYFEGGTVVYDVDRWEVTGLLRYEVLRDLQTHRRWYIEVGGGYLHEVYDRRRVLTPGFDGIPAHASFNKAFVKGRFTQERLKYHFHYVSGISNQLTLQTVQTFGEDEGFQQAVNILRMFARVGRNGNPALRLRLGTSTNRLSPFVPFVLDSYLNVRGSGNRVARGTAETTLNLEHRHTLYESPKIALQGVVFTDLSAWRPPGAPWREMFESGNVVTFGGGGARLFFRRIYHFGLRLDYGISLTDRSQRGFVLGVGQYF